MQLDVAVIHWPSALDSNAAETRRNLALALSSALKLTTAPESVACDWHQLVIGDFNEEPFGGALVHGLLAERERKRAQERSDYLYNATWRLMGEREPWPTTTRRALGSYYSSSAKGGTHWRVFDQLLVKGSLLKNSGWSLKEATLHFIEHAELFAADRGSMKTRFDHLPLSFSLEYARKSTSP